jgi:hypothetical protein
MALHALRHSPPFSSQPPHTGPEKQQFYHAVYSIRMTKESDGLPSVPEPLMSAAHQNPVATDLCCGAGLQLYAPLFSEPILFSPLITLKP